VYNGEVPMSPKMIPNVIKSPAKETFFMWLASIASPILVLLLGAQSYATKVS